MRGQRVLALLVVVTCVGVLGCGSAGPAPRTDQRSGQRAATTTTAAAPNPALARRIARLTAGPQPGSRVCALLHSEDVHRLVPGADETTGTYPYRRMTAQGKEIAGCSWLGTVSSSVADTWLTVAFMTASGGVPLRSATPLPIDDRVTVAGYPAVYTAGRGKTGSALFVSVSGAVLAVAPYPAAKSPYKAAGAARAPKQYEAVAVSVAENILGQLSQVTKPATTTASRQQGRRTLSFDYTTAEGWHYSTSIPYPSPGDFTFSKDSSSAPPCCAALGVQYSGPPVDGERLGDDNPGRPNGPQLTISPPYLAYQLTRSLRDTAYPGAGLCRVGGTTSSDYQDYAPYADELDCAPSQTDPVTSPPYSKAAEIDQLVAYLKQTTPVFVLTFLPSGNGYSPCTAWIDAAGETHKARNWSDCGSIHLSAHGGGG